MQLLEIRYRSSLLPSLYPLHTHLTPHSPLLHLLPPHSSLCILHPSLCPSPLTPPQVEEAVFDCDVLLHAHTWHHVAVVIGKTGLRGKAKATLFVDGNVQGTQKVWVHACMCACACVHGNRGMHVWAYGGRIKWRFIFQLLHGVCVSTPEL